MIFLVGNVFFICFLLLPLILYIFCDTQKSWIFFLFCFYGMNQKNHLCHIINSLYISSLSWICLFPGQFLTAFIFLRLYKEFYCLLMYVPSLHSFSRMAWSFSPIYFFQNHFGIILLFPNLKRGQSPYFNLGNTDIFTT